MSAAHAWSLPAESAPAPLGSVDGRLVLVAGGRQGVGVSTVAALLALVAGSQEDVLLVEATGEGRAHRLFGAARPAPGIGGLDTLEPEPSVVLPELSVLSVGEAEGRTLARRLAHLRRSYPLVVVDGGCRLRTALEVGGAGIDRLLCVTTGDATATAGAFAVLKALNSRTPGLPAGVLVNRAPLWAATEVDHHLRQAANQFLRRDLDVIGQVPLDECLRAGVRAGMPLHEVAAGSPAALALYEVARSLRSAPIPTPPAVFAPRPLQRRS